MRLDAGLVPLSSSRIYGRQRNRTAQGLEPWMGRRGGFEQDENAHVHRHGDVLSLKDSGPFSKLYRVVDAKSRFMADWEI